MSGDADKIRTFLSEAGLSQRAAARLLGVDERTMRRYCAGHTPVPRVVWLALERITEAPAKPEPPKPAAPARPKFRVRPQD